MLCKVRKVIWYSKMRFGELRLFVKEFFSGSKLNYEAYDSFTDSGLLVDVHSVEKGLGLRNTAPGHSGVVVDNLLDRLIRFSNNKNKIENFAYRETLRVIMAYIDFQEQFDITQFKSFSQIKKKYDKLCNTLGSEYVRAVKDQLCAGANTLSKDELLQGVDFDFESFICSRHSIRSFLHEPVDEDVIKRAVFMANRAPTACNRQPNRVYFTNKKEIVNQIDNLITGSNGFKGEIPNYILITTDRAYFSSDEQFQWYINGGIYLSYLVLSLHSLGIGNCIMQWKVFYKTENNLKHLFGIKKNEAIIAIIGCGYYEESTKCIFAQRKDVENTLKVLR